MNQNEYIVWKTRQRNSTTQWMLVPVGKEQ